MDYNNDFGTALQNQQNEARNSLLTQARDAQTSVFNELSEIDAQVAQHQSQENLNQMNIIGSLVKLSFNSGRPLSRQVLQVANQKLGLADDNQIISAGMNKNGGYDIEIGGYDANGNLIPRGRQTLSPQTIFNMSLNMPGIFEDADRRRISDRLVDNGLIARTDAQKMINSSYAMWNNNYTPQGTVVNSEWAGYTPRDPRKGGISTFASDGKGGFSRSEYSPMTREYSRQEWGTRDPSYKGRWKVLAKGPIGAEGQSGTRYENDKTGDVVFVPEGATPPWLGGNVDSKAQVAQINADAKRDVQALKNEGNLDVQNAKNKGIFAVEEQKGKNRIDFEKERHKGEVEITNLENEVKMNIAKGNWGVALEKNKTLQDKINKYYEVALKNAKTKADAVAIQKEYQKGRLALWGDELEIKKKEIDDKYKIAEAQIANEKDKTKIAEMTAKAKNQYLADIIDLYWSKDKRNWELANFKIDDGKQKTALEKLKQAEIARHNKALEDIEIYEIDTNFDITNLKADTREYLGELQADLKEKGIAVDKEKLVEAIRHNKKMEEAALIKAMGYISKSDGKDKRGNQVLGKNVLKTVDQMQTIINNGNLSRERIAEMKKQIEELLGGVDINSLEGVPEPSSQGSSSGGDNKQVLTREEKIARLRALKASNQGGN